MQRPILSAVQVVWAENPDQSGIQYHVYSPTGDLLLRLVFDYSLVDSDKLYEQAVNQAITELSKQYVLTSSVINSLLQLS